MAVITVLFTSCRSNNDYLIPTDNTFSSIQESENKKIISYLEVEAFSSVVQAAENLNGYLGVPLRSSINSIDLLSVKELEVYSMLETFVVPEDVYTLEEVKGLLFDIVNNNLNQSSEHYDLFISSVEIAIETYQYKLIIENKDCLRALTWRTVARIGKCVGGTVGSTLLGGLAGAAVGTVTLPIVGTVSGTTVGLWGGALTGAATFCSDIS